jgi:hypothetical protein
MPMGLRFAQLGNQAQAIFAAWAELAPEPTRPGFHGVPSYPSVLIDAHLALRNQWTHDETIAAMRMRLDQAEEMFGEILLRALDAVGPENVDAFMERTGARSWDVRIDDARLAAHATVGLARRRALRPIARDVERTLGRPARRCDEATLRRVLGPIVVAGLRPAAGDLPDVDPEAAAIAREAFASRANASGAPGTAMPAVMRAPSTTPPGGQASA